MSRSSLRGFAAGLLTATILLGGSYYYLEDHQQKRTIETLKEESERYGYVLMKPEKEKVSELPVHTTSNHQETTSEIEESFISYTLTVTKGMNSEDIIALLLQNGILNNAKDFQIYLEDHQLTRSIQIGTYEITSDMTHEQIAQTITG